VTDSSRIRNPQKASFTSMPTTRSASKQSHIKDFAEEPSGKAAKRKAHPEATNKPISSKKKARKRGTAANDDHEDKKTGGNSSELETIIINRSPVLQLWGATVASFIYPDLSWPTCLSIGNAISSLCAVSKGRSIGLIAPTGDTKLQDRGTKTRRKLAGGVREVEVMGFQLSLNEDAVIVGGKPKPLKEENLKHKFGDEKQYMTVKWAFKEGLQTWSGHEDELSGKAFHMYEQFRPNVANGQKGWGHKGELSIAEITRVVRR
jgi:hypothetical protein